MKKLKSGIKGMDELLDGGIPEGRIILVSGSSGTGKTIFASQFINEGIKNGEKGVFITLEQTKEKVIEDMNQVGINFGDLEKKGYLKIIGGPIGHIKYFKEKTKASMFDITTELKEVINETNAKRVVLDSVNLFTMLFETELERRKALTELVSVLDELGCTAILTCEIREGSNRISWHGFEEFVVDGTIVLYRLPFGNVYERAASVVKMRGVNHSQRIVSLAITKNGIEVYPNREPYAKV